MEDENNLALGNSTNNPSTSQQGVIDNGNIDDASSIASSASTLQMSMLENRLESEMTRLGNMVKDTVAGLTEHVNQRLSETDKRFQNLLADLIPARLNSNVNSSIPMVQSSQNTTPTTQLTLNTRSTVQPSQNNIGSGESPVQTAQGDSQQSLIGRSQCKIKPQHFDGSSDFEEFLSQFKITSEINGWQYKEKSLYLASCLTGDARSLLSELDHDGQRDYDTLTEKLANRFGSVNRSEIYRTQLKSRTRNKGETIPQLAQAIKKLVRQAYPGVHQDVVETLAIDHFIDALTDSDIRLRVREFDPKTLADAEKSALRLESHKIADKQRNRIVGQIETNTEQNNDRTQKESSPKLHNLQRSLDSLSDQIKNLQMKNSQSDGNKMSDKSGNFQSNNSYKNRYGKNNRRNQNNPPSSHGNRQRQTSNQNGRNFTSGQFASHEKSAQNLRGSNRGRQNERHASRDGSGRFENNQENWNQSSWRATTRQ